MSKRTGRSRPDTDTVLGPNANTRFPWSWVLVAASLCVLLGIVRAEPRVEQPAGYEFGRRAAAFLAVVLLSGLVWLFARHRSLAITAAFVCAAIVIARQGSRAAQHRAARDFRMAIDQRCDEHLRSMQQFEAAGGCRPESLADKEGAQQRNDDCRALRAEAEAILVTLERGAGFGGDLGIDAREEAWQQIVKMPWSRENRERLGLLGRLHGARAELADVLMRTRGAWRVDGDGRVVFDDGVPTDALRQLDSQLDVIDQTIAMLAGASKGRAPTGTRRPPRSPGP